MEIIFRPYEQKDIVQLTKLWNHITEEGISFPGDQLLSEQEASDMFAAQTLTACAVDGDEVLGFYILHPNAVGRCAHVANASYGVKEGCRGRGIGRRLVQHSLEQAKAHGFVGLQFNAVVETNTVAIGLYKQLGFRHVGTIQKGYHAKDGSLRDILIFYYLF